jgi:hypothetical protein
MPKRKRDYAREYARRLEKGLKKGLSRSAARGHPRAGEKPIAASLRIIDPFSREERAIKAIRQGSSLKKSASQNKIGTERLRRYLKENTDARRVKGKWQIVDRRARTFPFYSRGDIVRPWMTPEQASEAARYMQAVKQFLETGNNALLLPYVGRGIRDDKGKFHRFETDENTLYELDHRDEVVIPEQYRIANRRL